jgi:N-acetyl-beta-hexosaminidase
LPRDGDKPGPDSRESYRIRITPAGGEVRSPSSAGLFYAVQTLIQLVEGQGPGAALPEVDIEDWPSLAYRGVMVDFSHGPLLTEEEIKRQIDFLARWKGNQYYFYSELSIELQGYPLVASACCSGPMSPAAPTCSRNTPNWRRVCPRGP